MVDEEELEIGGISDSWCDTDWGGGCRSDGGLMRWGKGDEDEGDAG